MSQVPYVIALEGEAVRHDSLRFEHHPEASLPRLTYDQPDPREWEFGVLRARMGPRRGKPNFKAMNVHRQWRCMRDQLCQNCGQPAIDPETGRIWWLLASENGDDAEQGIASAPPLCRTCVHPALATCPHLRKHAALYSVGSSEPYAVLAHIFRPAPDMSASLMERKLVLKLDMFAALHFALALELRVLLTDLQRAPIP